ncbi:MAG: enoyl-CoA hydratase/isomerase family protein, partial [Deltaproteobacteria bacterium]|nr:enoyl-CoA hydratase/isomerase family protein [Deltaproteobacteria bacterium]
MAESDCTTEWRDAHCILRLTRPKKLNAITLAILDGLEECLDELDRGRARALVIIGEGDRAFSSGTDLTESIGLDPDANRAKVNRARALLLRLRRSPITSIAALNGLAYGGGLELALACTFRMAAPGARMALPEIKLGVLPAYGGTQFLPAVIGASRALDMMLTGRSVQPDEALAMGLINRLASDGATLLDEALSFAGEVTGHSQYGIERIRRCVAASGSRVTEAGLEIEVKAFEEMMESADA